MRKVLIQELARALYQMSRFVVRMMGRMEKSIHGKRWQRIQQSCWRVRTRIWELWRLRSQTAMMGGSRSLGPRERFVREELLWIASVKGTKIVEVMPVFERFKVVKVGLACKQGK